MSLSSFLKMSEATGSYFYEFFIFSLKHSSGSVTVFNQYLIQNYTSDDLLLSVRRHILSIQQYLHHKISITSDKRKKNHQPRKRR